jgi:SAM-dependent methyltransferase
MGPGTVACEWSGYLNEAFTFAGFPPGARVLDIGFGEGQQMRRLAAEGCRPFGLEMDPALARDGVVQGLAVCRAAAEALPFATAGFDGVVCKVVVPYTDEARAVAEIARVLRSGGTARVSYHGLGYFLRYLFTERNWKLRVYGARTIANTVVYALTGRRLPGFWGDSLYQSDRRLRLYYRRNGLELVEAPSSTRFAGAPVFLYHVLRRS